MSIIAETTNPVFNTELTAEIFVTTFAVGNEQGFSTGKWFDLTHYGNKADFIQAIKEYAIEELDDQDPEICFADYETNFDDEDLINEGFVSEEIWQLFALDENKGELGYSDPVAILQAFESLDGKGSGTVAERFEHASSRYYGEFDDYSDLAYEVILSQGDISKDSWVMDCIDFDIAGQKLADSYMDFNGYFFTR